MLFGKRPIQRAVVTLRGREGETLSLVTFTDGAYGITRNGEPVDGCHWTEEELDACIARLLRMAGKTAGGDGSGHGRSTERPGLSGDAAEFH